ncbi:retinal G protein coupled receptor a isoform X1 [Carcharodon carcharias]|uniref:retinal G protein coupled receptor a isoform X1 n=1 Tax=Carcharodon carcharias TaxID=13397 RepID=UPI001B7DDE9A|nr:retinal G protein coupled receptor a isoform X1 [Carcharodon carcharias]
MTTTKPLIEGFSDLEVFALGAVLLLEALLGLLLNAITILSFYKIKEVRTPSNLLIASLAVSDSGICLNAFVAAFSTFLRHWPYGSEGCQIHGFHGFLASLASINACAAIAWDRYHLSCSRSRLQWRSTVTVLSIVWGFAGFWATMPLLGWGKYNYEPLRTCCTLDYSGDRNFVLFSIPMALFEFVLPLLILVTSYQSCANKFKKTGQVKFNTGLPCKTLLICWGPYSLLCLYAVVENATALSPQLRMLPAILAKTSPVANAFVYALGNPNYRGGIWSFLTGQKMEPIEMDGKFK